MHVDDEARNAALEVCRRRMAAGETMADCLAGYPAEEREELARLLAMGARLTQLRRDPSPAFRAGLEAQLLARVDEARASTRQRGWGLWPFRLASAWRAVAVALVVLLIFAGSGVGVVAASDETLPDSPLYNVKTAKENVELVLAPNPEAKINVYAGQIATRGRELVVAVNRRKPQPVVEVLSRRVAVSVDGMVNQAVALRNEGRPLPARRAAIALRVMERELDRMAANASPAVRTTLLQLRTQLENEGARLEANQSV